jgi:hypothetical protein
LELLPSISGLKRLDFIVHAQRAAKKFGAELIYTWLPQSAALGAWMGYPVVLEMHADNSGKLGVWWMRQFWKQKRQGDDGHHVSVEKGFGALDQVSV